MQGRQRHQGHGAPKTCVTGYFEGRFTQRVNLRVPRLAAVRDAPGWPLVPAVFRLFWHGRGTPPGCKPPPRPAI